MHAHQVNEYHVFIASPGDVETERASVRAYFDHLNRTAAQARGVRFQVVDWENFATAGVGRPQELITQQTLERFRTSLVLVIVIMAQRFGTPSGTNESGTEEEVRWALSRNAESGFPEVKFFFRAIDQFTAPADLSKVLEAADQWRRVCEFRSEIKAPFAAGDRRGPGEREVHVPAIHRPDPGPVRAFRRSAGRGHGIGPQPAAADTAVPVVLGSGRVSQEGGPSS